MEDNKSEDLPHSSRSRTGDFLLSHSIQLAAAARSIFADALANCSVERAFDRKLLISPGHKLVLSPETRTRSATLQFAAPPDVATMIDLAAATRVLIVAAGKAAAPMLHSLLQRLDLPPGCELSGVLLAPQPPPDLPAGIAFFPGSHPLPSAASFAGARATLALLRDAASSCNPAYAGSNSADAARTFCFFLISGGASTMLEVPLDPAISLEDAIAFHRVLVHSGAPIAEINCVRKHFSAVKGGRLGHAAAALPNLTLLVSDVPPEHLDALGSGPTLPDTSTVAQCRDILARYHLMPRFPPSVRAFFASPHLPETPKPGDFPARALTLLSSDDLAEAARRHAESLGFTAFIDNSCDDQDFRSAAEYLLGRLRALRRDHPRVCLISAGEVTVPVPPEATAVGTGGRNQHFALYAATLLDPHDHPAAIFSAGSDGLDGNSRFAGAVLGSDSLSAAVPRTEAASAIDSARDALRRFDSSTYLHHLGATVDTGPTGNNLRDLRLLLSA